MKLCRSLRSFLVDSPTYESRVVPVVTTFQSYTGFLAVAAHTDTVIPRIQVGFNPRRAFWLGCRAANDVALNDSVFQSLLSFLMLPTGHVGYLVTPTALISIPTGLSSYTNGYM